MLFEALGPQNSRSSLSTLRLDHDVLDASLTPAKFPVTTDTAKPVKDISMFVRLGHAWILSLTVRAHSASFPPTFLVDPESALSLSFHPLFSSGTLKIVSALLATLSRRVVRPDKVGSGT